jgi:hypothetical protein
MQLEHCKLPKKTRKNPKLHLLGQLVLELVVSFRSSEFQHLKLQVLHIFSSASSIPKILTSGFCKNKHVMDYIYNIPICEQSLISDYEEGNQFDSLIIVNC